MTKIGDVFDNFGGKVGEVHSDGGGFGALIGLSLMLAPFFGMTWLLMRVGVPGGEAVAATVSLALALVSFFVLPALIQDISSGFVDWLFSSFAKGFGFLTILWLAYFVGINIYYVKNDPHALFMSW